MESHKRGPPESWSASTPAAAKRARPLSTPGMYRPIYSDSPSRQKSAFDAFPQQEMNAWLSSIKSRAKTALWENQEMDRLHERARRLEEERRLRKEAEREKIAQFVQEQVKRQREEEAEHADLYERSQTAMRNRAPENVQYDEEDDDDDNEESQFDGQNDADDGDDDDKHDYEDEDDEEEEEAEERDDDDDEDEEEEAEKSTNIKVYASADDSDDDAEQQELDREALIEYDIEDEEDEDDYYEEEPTFANQQLEPLRFESLQGQSVSNENPETSTSQAQQHSNSAIQERMHDSDEQVQASFEGGQILLDDVSEEEPDFPVDVVIDPILQAYDEEEQDSGNATSVAEDELQQQDGDDDDDDYYDDDAEGSLPPEGYSVHYEEESPANSSSAEVREILELDDDDSGTESLSAQQNIPADHDSSLSEDEDVAPLFTDDEGASQADEQSNALERTSNSTTNDDAQNNYAQGEALYTQDLPYPNGSFQPVNRQMAPEIIAGEDIGSPADIVLIQTEVGPFMTEPESGFELEEVHEQEIDVNDGSALINSSEDAEDGLHESMQEVTDFTVFTEEFEPGTSSEEEIPTDATSADAHGSEIIEVNTVEEMFDTSDLEKQNTVQVAAPVYHTDEVLRDVNENADDKSEHASVDIGRAADISDLVDARGADDEAVLRHETVSTLEPVHGDFVDGADESKKPDASLAAKDTDMKDHEKNDELDLFQNEDDNHKIRSTHESSAESIAIDRLQPDANHDDDDDDLVAAPSDPMSNGTEELFQKHDTDMPEDVQPTITPKAHAQDLSSDEADEEDDEDGPIFGITGGPGADDDEIELLAEDQLSVQVRQGYGSNADSDADSDAVTDSDTDADADADAPEAFVQAARVTESVYDLQASRDWLQPSKDEASQQVPSYDDDQPLITTEDVRVTTDENPGGHDIPIVETSANLHSDALTEEEIEDEKYHLWKAQIAADEGLATIQESLDEMTAAADHEQNHTTENHHKRSTRAHPPAHVGHEHEHHAHTIESTTDDIHPEILPPANENEVAEETYRNFDVMTDANDNVEAVAEKSGDADQPLTSAEQEALQQETNFLEQLDEHEPQSDNDASQEASQAVIAPVQEEGRTTRSRNARESSTNPADASRPYKCPVPGCIKAYKNEGGLKYHRTVGKCQIDSSIPSIPEPQIAAPATDRLFACEMCDKSYKNKNGLKYHMQHAH